MRRFIFVVLCVWVSSVVDAQGTFRDAYNNFRQQALFIICDPTYIGVPIGMTMPDMDNKTAKVILL